jgi:ribosomal protein S19E (S16A)
VGVGRLKKVHGSTKNRGSRPNHHVDASGSVDRKVIQALEKLGVLEQDEEKGGRRITQSGQRDLDRMAPFSNINIERERLMNNKQALLRRHSRRKMAKRMNRWSRL